MVWGGRYLPHTPNFTNTQSIMEENINSLWESLEDKTTTEQTEETEVAETTETAEVEEETTEEETSEGESEENEEESTEEKKEDKPKELSPYEKAILAEMERRVSEGDELLATAMQSADKNISACYSYVKEQARKQAVAGCAMIEDAVVYGWAHHYYIESKETIDAELKPKATKKAEEKAKKTAEQKKAEEQKKKVFANPLLAALMKKGAKIAEGDEVAVTKTKEKKDEQGNVLQSTSVKTAADGTRTTTLTKEGKTYTMTEFALF